MSDDDLHGLILAVLLLAERPLTADELEERVAELAAHPNPRALVAAELARRN